MRPAVNPVLRISLLVALLAAALTALAVALFGDELRWPAAAAGTALALALMLGAGALVRRLYRARRVDATSAPGLTRVVAQIAAAAGVPPPSLWLVDDAAPGAFATGALPRRASIVLTTGLVAMLPERELRAVIAHEIAHIRRHDTGAAALCVALAGALPLLLLGAFGADVDDDEDGAPAWLLAAMAPFAAALLHLAFGAAREFDADRLAARWCGDPGALADALARIERHAHRLPRGAQRHPPTAALLTVAAAPRPGWPRWVAAHPSTELRIARLQAQSGGREPQV